MIMPKLAAALLCITILGSASMPVTEVGVYYFPGWHRDTFTGNKDPWQPIRNYPDREPKIGWYSDTDQVVLSTQAAQIKAAGIDFVVFDWYFEHGRVQAAAPLDGYLKLPTGIPRAALMWCRHGASPPTTAAEWRTIVATWVGYAKLSNFYRIGGRPVVMVFDTGRMDREARLAGSSLAAWVLQAQAAAKSAGIPPFHFVAGVWNGDDPTISTAAAAGFAEITSYNYRRAPGDLQDAKGYPARDQMYRRIWAKMVGNKSGLPVVLPITSGWDRRPWGGSSLPAVDNSEPTDSQFRVHLAAAHKLILKERLSRAIICCWNEYGEGSIIEPTKRDNDAKLRIIRQTFSEAGDTSDSILKIH